MEDSYLTERLELPLGKRRDELVGACLDRLEILQDNLVRLRQEVSALAAYQASRGPRLVASEVTEPLPGTVTIEADQVLLNGFHGVEHTVEGTPFRWTGPSLHFCFSIFVDRRAGAALELQALSSMEFEIQKNLTLVSDGEVIPVEIVLQRSGFAIRAFLPPREDRGATSLVFVLPKVLVPPGGKDSRLLGIAFARLVVVALEAELADAIVSDKVAAQ